MNRPLPILALALMFSLAMTTAASAEQRFASPSGSSAATCQQAAPCSLDKAVTSATSGDEVIVGAGTYVAKEVLVPGGTPTPDVSVHGDFGGARPLIVSTAQSGISMEGGRLEYLEIVSAGGESASYPVTCGGGTVVRRVRASASTEYSAAIFATGCTITDSVAFASGPEASALVANATADAEETVVRNVTAIATGAESFGLAGTYFGDPPVEVRALDAANTIASGTAGDLSASSPFTGGAIVTIANSNFDTSSIQPGSKLQDLGGNQKAAPLFVNAAAGDFHEAVGSPTIDAGAGGPLLGPSDFDGTPRILGAAPDIGAYEFVPPPAPPLPVAVSLQSLSVKPAVFIAANSGGAILSAKTGKGKPAPVGATVSYSLSAAGTAAFTVEQLVTGRKAGKKCVKQTKANKGNKKCGLLKPVKGSFTHAGAAGANSFKLAGRLGSKALKPGRYMLVGSVGSTEKRAPFKVVK